MQLPILYKRTKTGATQQWQITTLGDKFYTEEGLVNGKITQSKPTICKAKNIGRSNATTAVEQASAEALAKWTKKKEKGYTEDVDSIDNVDMHYEPMLAQKFEKYKTKITYPVFINAKLDGIRAVVSATKAQTRNGKEHKCIPHIQDALKPFFKEFPNAILDGELYNHELHDDFNKISSLVRKSKPTKEDLVEAKEIVQYHIYDCPVIGNLNESSTFYTRYKAMTKALKDIVGQHSCIKLVDAIKVNNEAEVVLQHESLVERGYEGIIVRLDMPYENKRSKYLLKYKTFCDEEYDILNIREGKGNKTGMAAHADFVTKDGKSFTANIKGPHSWLKELLVRKEEAIGKVGTVKYFNLTPDGIPRFPYLIDINRWKYE